MSFIQIEHANVCRGTETVLHDINLSIAPGESVAILGPNGCGKSTLLKTLTCELYPLAEPAMRVELFGRARWDVTQLRRIMGVVTSEPPCRDALSVPGFDVVLTGFFSAARLWPNLAVTDDMRTRAEQAMRDAGVEHLRTRPLRSMSSGQQKRIMIARALAASGTTSGTASGTAPGHRVLLLDEPANTLDLVAQRDLRATVQRLAEQGTTILLVTHHVEDIVPAVQRTILLKDGRIVADGPTDTVLTTASLSHLFNAPVQLSKTDNTYRIE